MKFKYAILYVENVEKTLDFYQRAFGFKNRFSMKAVIMGSWILAARQFLFLR